MIELFMAAGPFKPLLLLSPFMLALLVAGLVLYIKKRQELDKAQDAV
jgi:hypothetical protein